MKKIYVDCFYYGFWIDKCELDKYNLSKEFLQDKTHKIYIKNLIGKPSIIKKYKNNFRMILYFFIYNVLVNYLI